MLGSLAAAALNHAVQRVHFPAWQKKRVARPLVEPPRSQGTPDDLSKIARRLGEHAVPKKPRIRYSNTKLLLCKSLGWTPWIRSELALSSAISVLPPDAVLCA
jgi:hypothetical protein